MEEDDELAPYLKAISDYTGKPVREPEWLTRHRAELQALADVVSERQQAFGDAWSDAFRSIFDDDPSR